MSGSNAQLGVLIVLTVIALIIAPYLNSAPRRTAGHRLPRATGPPAAAGPHIAASGTAEPGANGRQARALLEPSMRARLSCPATATACVDLFDRITWLQRHGQIDYGPVPMEPGSGTQATPRGTFYVSWKAGAHYVSTSYRVPIPWPVFFGNGGIAFHAGSLRSSSHGCVHLSMASARYYHDHLPVGAEVVVFGNPLVIPTLGQPGAGQPGAGQPGAGQPGAKWPGASRHGGKGRHTSPAQGHTHHRDA